MNRLLLVAWVVSAIAITGPVSAATLFQATLSGDQEVPPTVTTASGTASLTLNDAQTRLEINIQINGLDLDGLQTPGNAADDVTGAHIHNAPAGNNGGVVFGFIGPNSDANGDLVIDPVAGTIFSGWDLLEGNGTTLQNQLTDLLNDGLYINVHTSTFPSGEIRGQIQVVPIPAAFWLFGSGLLGLVGIARRKKGA